MGLFSCLKQETGAKLLCSLCAYVITRDVYERLDYAVGHEVTNEKGEVELMDTLEYVRKEKG